MSFRTATWMLLLLVGLIGSSCSLVAVESARPSVCAGVGEDIGGCDNEQPEFRGTDCAAVGREFGAMLDERTLAIIRGPEVESGEARSVRLMQAMVLLSVRANDHLREIDLRADCDVPEFLEAAEGEFSTDLRSSVGGALFDGAPAASYGEWLAEVTRNLAVIDDEE